MKRPEQLIITLLVLMLAVAVLSMPVLAVDPTTELHIVKYADDRKTILNETTVDYHWLEDNLPIHGDGVTRYYQQGPVFEGVWEDAHPDEDYDGWNPDEDIQISILYKGDFGAVMGTDVKDICEYIGGAEDGDEINVRSSDGWTRGYPYSQIYEPDPRQGPAVLCWYSGSPNGTLAQKPQGSGYPDTGYIVGMRMIFFADNSTNPWGWHVFGNWDMHECWDEKYWNKGGNYWSAVGTSAKWVSEIRIYSQEPAGSPAANFTTNITSGTIPLTVAFTDTSTNNPKEWFWDFDDSDSTNNTDQNPVHTYTEAGTYDVTLTATNSGGSGTTESTTITAVEPGKSGTTEIHVVKYARDNVTILNEMTVDYQWLKDNLPVQGDGVTHYYLQGPVSEAAWTEIRPYKRYNSLNPEEDVESSMLDLGAVSGTDLADICKYIGGTDGDNITLISSDDSQITFPSQLIYEPDIRQGPAVLCWHNEDEGYTGVDYDSGMRLAFFADNSTNPWKRHIFGDTDMKNCWDRTYRTYNGTLPSSAAASLCRINEVRILSQELPKCPTTSFTINVTTGTPPLAVAFTDTSTGAPSAWSWDFGDGTTSHEQHPVHTYAAPGTYPAVYTVSLTATNNVGDNATTQSECITVTAGYANFIANRTGGLPPLAVAFTDTSAGNPTGWSWDFGDGTTSDEQNPIHTYTKIGTYTVTLIVTGAFGSDTIVTTDSIDKIRVLSGIGTTTLHIIREAATGETLNEKTVDYHWLEENLPVQGDGVTKYYHQWWVFQDAWDEVHRGEPYNFLNPREDIPATIEGGKGNFGAVKGTDVKDICDLVGGASEGERIRLDSRDGYKTGLNQEWVYNPDPRQGPAVICWYNGGGGSGNQGIGYTDAGYIPAMRLIFFADNSTNPWGWHVFGNWDMHEAWNLTFSSATGWSAKWIDQVVILTNDPAIAPVVNFTANMTSGSAPLAVAFNDTSTISPYAWSWDFGDGTTSDERSPVHTYTAGGNYTVTLTATNCIGSNSTTALISVDKSSSITLNPGWNFVSTPKTLTDGNSTFSIFKEVNTANHSILTYTPANQWEAMGADDEFRPLDGIWIYSGEACEIQLDYATGSARTPPAKDLDKGWNSVGFSDTVSESAARTLLSVKDNWATLIGYDSSTQKYDVSVIRGAVGRHGDDQEMIPMQGYWLYLDEPDTLCAIGA